MDLLDPWQARRAARTFAAHQLAGQHQRGGMTTGDLGQLGTSRWGQAAARGNLRALGNAERQTQVANRSELTRRQRAIQARRWRSLTEQYQLGFRMPQREPMGKPVDHGSVVDLLQIVEDHQQRVADGAQGAKEALGKAGFLRSVRRHEKLTPWRH